MPLILGTNSIKDTGYDVDNSCRFNGADSAELTKTFGSAGNQKTWTFSCWLKRSTDQIAVSDHVDSILEAGHGSTPWFVFTLNQDQLAVAATAGSSVGWKTATLFRDTSAWYHIVLAVDTTSSASSISNGSTDRFRIYVNGVQQTLSGGSVPSQNADLQWNGTAGQHMFGASYAGQFFDGYVAEVAFIDGSALNPSSFGEYDSDSPKIWKPKDFKDDVTFGTNGYYLDFADSGDLGDDESGNGNDWTEANLAATDQSTDTPTNNFATLNSLNVPTSNAPTFSEGNLRTVTMNSDPGYFGGTSTIGVSQGKWYAEFNCVSASSTTGTSGSGDNHMFGITFNPGEVARNGASFSVQIADSFVYLVNGKQYSSATGTGGSAYGDTFASGDIIGVAVDLDNSKLYFSKNGTFQNSGDPTSGSTGTGAISITAGETYFFYVTDGGGSKTTNDCNFGSPSFSISSGNADANGYGNFEYSVPSGYYSLCTKNLAEFG